MSQIVLVDDDPLLASIISDALTSDGHIVGWIGDSKEAIARMSRRPPDLAIVDCVMPGVPGTQLVAQMRVHPTLCKVPVLMLTARTAVSDRAIAYRSGADDYLAKPADLDELAGRVDALLARGHRPVM